MDSDLRRVSSSSELLHFVYVDSDVEETTTAASRDDFISTDESTREDTTDESSLSKVTTVESMVRRRASSDRAMQRQVDRALQDWGLSRRGILTRTNNNNNNADNGSSRHEQVAIRNAVESWAASPQAVKGASKEASEAHVKREEEKQKKIKSSVQEWAQRLPQAATPPPPPPVTTTNVATGLMTPAATTTTTTATTAAAITTNTTPAVMAGHPPTNASSPLVSAVVPTGHSPLVDAPLVARQLSSRILSARRKHMLLPVDASACLFDVRNLYMDANRWKSASFVTPTTMLINIGDFCAPQPNEVARSVAIALKEKNYNAKEVFDGSTRTGCVLRAMSRSILAPIEHSIKDHSQGMLTFNKVLWKVNVACHFSDHVEVLHERTEEAAPGHHEGEKFAFRWSACFSLRHCAPFPGVVLHGDDAVCVLEVSSVVVRLLDIQYSGGGDDRGRIVGMIRDLFEGSDD